MGKTKVLNVLMARCICYDKVKFHSGG